LAEEDLRVIKVLIHNEGDFLFDLNYLVLTETLVKKNLLNVYTVFDEDQIELKLLNNMSGALCCACLTEYSHIESIKPVLQVYKQYQKPT
jgi:hypothetical protein